MCGIAGFTGEIRKDILERMSLLVSHRGPDDFGEYIDQLNKISFVHRRLSILDLAGGGQPMWSNDRSMVVVFNGEIYNHADLRSKLEQLGYKFNSNNSDTEVLLHGYREWGDKLPLMLSGMFAFCIHDIHNNKLFFSRDRFGKKPLYYACKNKNIIFSSELNSLMAHPELSRDLDTLSVQKYFGYGYIPSPRTIYKNICKLPGGHSMVFDLQKRTLKIEKYWEFSIIRDEYYEAASIEDLSEELLGLLTNAVQKRLISDVPVGVFLSGGLDSSSILGLVSCIKKDREVKSFSIGLDDPRFDESEDAKFVADFFGVTHLQQTIGMQEANDAANQILLHMDEPMADSSIVPTYLLSKFAKKSVSVALSGDGADELFAGYGPFKALQTAKIYSNIVPKYIHSGVEKVLAYLPTGQGYFSYDYKLKRFIRGVKFQPALRCPIWMSPLTPSEIEDFLGTKVEIEELYSEAIELWNSSNGLDEISKTSEFYSRIYLQDDILNKVDRASMMVGLEVRSPFLDNDVVEFARRLPSKYKIFKGNQKYILKQAMKKILPSQVLIKKKQGFAIPLTNWLKKWDIKYSTNKLFCNDKLKSFISEHKTGKKDNRLFLWSWLVISRYIDVNHK